jgi:hypothetical protein
MAKASGRAGRWTALVSEWRSGGASQAAFCREHGLNANTFNYWKLRVLRQRPGKRRQRRDVTAAMPAKRSGDFTPVRVIASPACAFEVQLRGGRTLRVAATFDETSLRRLIGVLENE